MYPSTSLFIAVGQLAIVILVLFSYPLQVHPCRNCLDKVVSDGDALIHHKLPDNDDESDENEKSREKRAEGGFDDVEDAGDGG